MDTRNAGAASAGLLALLIGAGGNDIGMPPDPDPKERPTIVVIGGGVRGKDFGTDLGELPPTQRSSGAAMAIGIVASLAKNRGLERLVEIEWRDDHNSMQVAAQIARELAGRREVVAVIGFTQSSTAAAALPILAGSGIPVLLPIATSVELGRSPIDGTKQDGWVVYRAIADDAVQALALEWALSHDLDSEPPTTAWKRVMLLREVGPDASAYVDALAYMLEQRIDARIVARIEVDRQNWDCDRIAAEAVAHNADVACFLGYPETGRRVLFSLAPPLLNKLGRTRALPLVMPDACCRLLAEDLPNRDFLVTFPSEGTGEQGETHHLSYEKSGEAACDQLCLAISKRRDDGLSRRALRSFLRDKDAERAYWASRAGSPNLQTVAPIAIKEEELDRLRQETAARAGRSNRATAEDRR